MSRRNMELWTTLFQLLWQLRDGFARLRTFQWFCVAVVGFCIRGDLAGVTSFVRCVELDEKYYHSLLQFFHSSSFKLSRVTELWVELIIRIAPLLVINGRIVLVADGINNAKEGKQMPGVKSLHNSSQSNSKATFIMGHSIQEVVVLAGTLSHVVAIPLAARIHSGIVTSNRWTRTLLDKIISLVNSLNIKIPYYLVGDAYYASGSVALSLLETGNHLITRARNNAVAYLPPLPSKKRCAGRPRTYGKKVTLRNLFDNGSLFAHAPSPVYGDTNVVIAYYATDMVWRPTGRMMRFVLVNHPIRGKIILMTSDLTLEPLDIIKIYGLRFKIEVSFKASKHSVGAYVYHFWSEIMKPIKRGSGNQHLHRETKRYRKAMLAKIDAYHAFIQTGLIAQGILQYLAIVKTKAVWSFFGSWLRTIREGVLPSEMVVMTAMNNSYPEFLSDSSADPIMQKFILDRLDSVRGRRLKHAA